METIRKTEIAFFLCLLLFCSSCEDVDFSGFLFSSDPVNERVKQSLEWNDSHLSRDITVSGAEYSLLIAGDSHVGGTVNLDAFLTQANTTGISGLVIVGDLTSGKKEDFEIFKQELESKNSGPAFLIIGNHDLFFNGWDTYFDLFGSSTYSFTVRSNDTTDLYICLDSGGGTHGWRQLEWLKDLLEKERNNARYCILFTHDNFFRAHRTISTNPLVDELRVMMDMCYTYSVDMVIMGHDHIRSEEFLGKTSYITLDALEDDFEDASYLKLQVKGSGVNYTFIGL
jgi:3',5'-cyclic AMP phosphodiesterase CpdA